VPTALVVEQAASDPGRSTGDGIGRGARAAIGGAIGTLLGIVVSGPVAVVLVQALHPQPPWVDARTFAARFHPLQTLPYLGGVVLVGGLLLLVVGLRDLAGARHKTQANLALVLAGVFAALVFLNYVVQSTVVPVLASDYDEANGPLLGALTMANPRSLGWALEMWGWGFAGVATGLLGPVFHGARLENATRRALMANAAMSVAGTAWTVIAPGWVMTPAGLAMYAAWNALLVAMALLVFAAVRRRVRRETA
jgi:hypothetical protein